MRCEAYNEMRDDAHCSNSYTPLARSSLSIVVAHPCLVDASSLLVPIARLFLAGRPCHKMGEDGGRHDTALPIPAPAPAPASAGVTENGASSVPNASVTAARPPARDAEQVRGNLGSTALDHPQQQQQRQGRPAASIAAPPRYVAPFFAQAAQPEISESVVG